MGLGLEGFLVWLPHYDSPQGDIRPLIHVTASAPNVEFLITLERFHQVLTVRCTFKGGQAIATANITLDMQIPGTVHNISDIEVEHCLDIIFVFGTYDTKQRF